MTLESDHFKSTPHDHFDPVKKRFFYPLQLEVIDFPLAEVDSFEELKCPTKDQLMVSPRNGFIGDFLKDGGQMARVDCPHSNWVDGRRVCEHPSSKSEREFIICCVEDFRTQVHGVTEETVNIWAEVRKPGEVWRVGESFVSY